MDSDNAINADNLWLSALKPELAVKLPKAYDWAKNIYDKNIGSSKLATATAVRAYCAGIALHGDTVDAVLAMEDGPDKDKELCDARVLYYKITVKPPGQKDDYLIVMSSIQMLKAPYLQSLIGAGGHWMIDSKHKVDTEKDCLAAIVVPDATGRIFEGALGIVHSESTENMSDFLKAMQRWGEVVGKAVQMDRGEPPNFTGNPDTLLGDHARGFKAAATSVLPETAMLGCAIHCLRSCDGVEGGDKAERSAALSAYSRVMKITHRSAYVTACKALAVSSIGQSALAKHWLKHYSAVADPGAAGVGPVHYNSRGVAGFNGPSNNGAECEMHVLKQDLLRGITTSTPESLVRATAGYIRQASYYKALHSSRGPFALDQKHETADFRDAHALVQLRGKGGKSLGESYNNSSLPPLAYFLWPLLTTKRGHRDSIRHLEDFTRVAL